VWQYKIIMEKIKDILYYGTIAYLGCGITYCAAVDAYHFAKAKFKQLTTKKDNLEFKLNPENDIYI
jgi:hypothetical protein